MSWIWTDQPAIGPRRSITAICEDEMQIREIRIRGEMEHAYINKGLAMALRLERDSLGTLSLYPALASTVYPSSARRIARRCVALLVVAYSLVLVVDGSLLLAANCSPSPSALSPGVPTHRIPKFPHSITPTHVSIGLCSVAFAALLQGSTCPHLLVILLPILVFRRFDILQLLA